MKIVSSRSNDDSLIFERINDNDTLGSVAELFSRTVDEKYIALGDFESGRINRDLKWNDDTIGKFIEEYEHSRDTDDYIVVKNRNNEIIGLMIVGVDMANGFAVLYDVIIDKEKREARAGTKAYNWLECQLKQMGIKRVLLESGINNVVAHEYFKKLGFRKLAVEFIKEIS
jgi:ribosomal protein S18 acetylase RimI-like enzyme